MVLLFKMCLILSFEHVNQVLLLQESRTQSLSSSPSNNPVKNYVLSQLAKLMTACVIIRVEDFTLFKVTTSSKKQQQPKEFLKGEALSFVL